MGKERETRFSLTSGRTRWQRPVDTTSHGEQHSFTSLSENRNHTKPSSILPHRPTTKTCGPNSPNGGIDGPRPSRIRFTT